MNATRTEQEWRGYLQTLVNEEASETLTLEFKSGHALNKLTRENRDEIHEEITKDVTALANAEGGHLIYGIQKKVIGKNGVAASFQPVNEGGFSKETLEQVISRAIPGIPGVRVDRVALTPPDGCCYVVVVPQGNSAHQALDGKFYCRRETEVVAMSQQEIRDLLSRRNDSETNEPKTEDEWRAFFSRLLGRPETLRLEFKRGQALNKINPKETSADYEEITRDVSALANAGGGYLIYGIEEVGSGKNKVAGSFQPVIEARFGTHQLEQVLNLINPRIAGIRVERVTIPESSGGCCYVVIVPKPTALHMALDGRFHCRYGTEVLRMDPGQIEQAIFQRKRPKLGVKLKWGTNTEAIELLPMLIDCDLHLEVSNSSDVPALNWSIRVCVPVQTPRGKITPRSVGNARLRRGVWQVDFTEKTFGAVFRGMAVYPSFAFSRPAFLRSIQSEPIHLEAFADGGFREVGSVTFEQATGTWREVIPL